MHKLACIYVLASFWIRTDNVKTLWLFIMKIRWLKWFRLQSLSPGQPPVIFTTKQKNYHTKAQKSQITQTPALPTASNSLLSHVLFLLLFHCLIFLLSLHPNWNNFLIGAHMTILPLQILHVRKEASLLQEKWRDIIAKVCSFIQNRLILLFFTP